MPSALSAIIPVFLVIALGHFLLRSKIVPSEMWAAIEHLCFYILFPFLIVRSLARAELSNVPVLQFSATILLCILIMAGLLLLSRPLLARSFAVGGPTFTSLFQGATRWHGFVAISIIGPLYGTEGVTLAALAIGVIVPVNQIMNVAILVTFGEGEGEQLNLKRVLQRLSSNPFIVACFLGLFLNVTGLPDIAFNTIDIVSAGALGIGLLTVGAGFQFNLATEMKGLVSFGVALRLIGMPVLMFFLAQLFGLTGLAFIIALIVAAVPTASSSYIMARKMGGDAPLMANIITFQILGAIITLPLVIALAEIWTSK